MKFITPDRPNRVSAPPHPTVGWTAGAAVFTWLLSTASLLLTSLGAQLLWTAWFYWRHAALPTEADVAGSRSLVLALVLSTFVAHAVTLFWCWKLITHTSPRGLRTTLGLDWCTTLWSRQGAALVAAALSAPLFLAFGAWLERYLPNAKTDLDRVLALGPGIRLAVASVAALSAPLVEEVVYRGVLFGGLQRQLGTAVAVVLVAALFLAVHVPQYWGGWAGLTMLAVLSFVLTLLRAATGSILPALALHYAFNGVQAVAIIFFWELLATSSPTTP
ncbi:MAG: CPBP family intramembrane metalloprotease [Chloracidobacterium sp.]|nr:CPBP family intramembrane metalloprotease [Chloracidobacterium sp.]MDW8216981.1 CPBP family intramembrane glutamic endopeptidase [Acidobacteriota bacterium]